MSEEDKTQNSGTTAVQGNDQAVSANQPEKALKSDALAPTGEVEAVNRELQEKATLRKAKEMNIPYVNIAKTPLNPDYLKAVEFEDAKRGRLIPFFKVGKKLRIATDDPNRPETKAVIADLQNNDMEVSVNLASTSGIDDALKAYEKSASAYKKVDIVEKVEEGKIQNFAKEIEDLSTLPKKLEELTAEQGLNLLNIGAMKTNASDVHYEPYTDKVEVRFRIDGVLNKVFDLKPEVYKNISNQIKYESKMKLNVYNIPQDGRYTFTFNEKTVAVRVSSIPTPEGESFVCRYLPGGKKQLKFDELGFQGLAYKKLDNASKISQGMILVTGPTGSGKTSTLYSLLSVMNTPQNKVITLEDPVEYAIEGVTQSQIDEKGGYTFTDGLKTLLRQDPDVIMLGEIRDIDTAETASQAALTGHVLLSTLHTNSAIETIPRLINMGLPPFMVAPTLDTVIAQRLVRRVCPDCVKQEPINDSEKKAFEQVMTNLENVNKSAVVPIPEMLPKVTGCDKCSNTGYRGRVAVVEIFNVTSEMKDLILNNSSSIKMIVAARKEGMITMREDGFLKVAQGLTTLEEVYRVTNVSY
ncbi:hypothetical protein GF354_01385 [Candidatus Peregrinibacteria bacterium]|nr:hypothetical protein [Candidatus Peregrinibacteria bacterium]